MLPASIQLRATPATRSTLARPSRSTTPTCTGLSRKRWLTRAMGTGASTREHSNAMRHFRAIFLALAVQLFAPGVEAAVVPIQFGGQKSELVISEVSDRMARIELLPIGDPARPNITN